MIKVQTFKSGFDIHKHIWHAGPTLSSHCTPQHYERNLQTLVGFSTYINSLVRATIALASGKRGVIRQSNGNGRLEQVEGLILQKKMKDAHMTVPAFTVSNVSGIIGTPASPLTAEMLAAQRIDTISMNRTLFAMSRPMQILRLL